MNPAQPKPSVFISYAHKDGMEFARRLEFAFQLLVDPYRDQTKLQTGPFEPQLLQEIEKRDYFLLIMSPYSLRDGGWCRKELDYAVAHKNDRIALAKIYSDDDNPLQVILSKAYTYGDFTSDFEVGFRQLTEMFLGYPVSSWEGLPTLSDADILDTLRQGRVPGLIGRELAESVFVEQFLPMASIYAANNGLVIRSPRTIMGVLRECGNLIDQSVNNRDFLGAQKALEVIKTVRQRGEYLTQAKDDDHAGIGLAVFETISNVRTALSEDAFSARDAMKAASFQRENFEFNVAEKLRELIQIHARRSRYLY